MGPGCPRALNPLGVPADGGQIFPCCCPASWEGSGGGYGKGRSPNSPLGPFTRHQNQVTKVGRLPLRMAAPQNASIQRPRRVRKTLKVGGRETFEATAQETIAAVVPLVQLLPRASVGLLSRTFAPGCSSQLGERGQTSRAGCRAPSRQRPWLRPVGGCWSWPSHHEETTEHRSSWDHEASESARLLPQ